MAVPRKLKTRLQWARKICAAHKETVGAFLKLGRTLLAAKDALPHGEFLKMVEQDLPFGEDTAQRLMRIASDPKIANAARGRFLPAAWRTAFELTKLPPAEFDRAIKSGAINPQMTRQEATALTSVQPKISYETKVIKSVGYVTGEQPLYELPRSIRAERFTGAARLVATLERLESAVKDLTGETLVRRDVIDNDFKKRIEVAGNRLLDLVDKLRR